MKIVIVNQITLVNGDSFLALNIFFGHVKERLGPPQEDHLHFDVVDARGEWNQRRSFPYSEIETINPRALTIDL